MNTSNINLFRRYDERHVLTPSETIISMLEHIDEKGLLYTEEAPCEPQLIEDNNVYRCKMHRYENDVADCLQRYERNFKSILKNAKPSDYFADRIAARDIERHAKNLRKFIPANAPKAIINNEEILLAQAIVINSCCSEVKPFKNSNEADKHRRAGLAA